MTAEAEFDLAPGSLIAGRFRVEGPLGSGGMATVYRATDLARQRPIAVKLLREEVSSSPEAIERLKREGEVLSGLRHPNIVALETFGKLDDGRVFVAMELLPGETLGSRMRREKRLPTRILTHVVEGACAALTAAHNAGVVHRDLKPDNIFLVGDPEKPVTKLLDFGISKVYGGQKLTRTGQILGTPRYMAPEQLSAERDLDTRVDVYAMGIILYEALAGAPPFLASTPTDLIVAILGGKSVPIASLRPDLPPSVETVVTRAMSRTREARYGSAMELAAAWMNACEPVAGLGQRPGMQTTPLGSMESPEDVNSVGERADGSGRVRLVDSRMKEGLVPGTFGVEPARKQVPAAVAPPVPRPAPAPSAPEPRARRVADPWHEESRPAAPHVPAENPGVWADASATPSEPEEPGAFNTAALRSPMGQRRWLVLVIALVLGAITAAGALAVFLHDDAPSTPPPTPPPAENRSAAKTVAAAPVPAPPATFAEPQPLTALVPMNTENREPSAHASKQRRRPQNKQRPTPPTPGRLEPPAESDGVALMREAQTAFRAGNPEECISLVNRAIEHGAPAIALKLQGDCLRRAGQNAAAVRSYERFCRLMPDHPALAEVRSIVSTLGGSCP